MSRAHMMALLKTVVVALATIGTTWGARQWVERSLGYGESVDLQGAVLRLTRGENSGVALGIFQGSPVVPWLSAAALVVVAILLGRSLWVSRLGPATLGLILGGGLANLLDRWDDGHVTDYIDVGIDAWRYPTFNLPDTAVVVGLGVTLWLLTRDSAGDWTRSAHNQKLRGDY